MQQLGNDIFSFAFGAVALGALIAAVMQIVKNTLNWQGRIVKEVTAFVSLSFGLAILLLTSDGHGWKALLFIILRGIVAGLMITLSALGVHNWLRPTGKGDATMQSGPDAPVSNDTTGAPASTDDAPNQATGE